MAIEFSQPEAAFENIKACLENQVPVVSGTTGWLNRKGEVEDICLKNNGTFFYASNFSIGVNLFFKVNKFLASLMMNYPEYDVAMEEIHHLEKKDAPSGTAITLAEDIIKLNPSKKSWTNQPSRNPSGLFIKSLREGQVPGTHTIHYTSKIDEISIKHTAFSREGFALGAVLVAEWAVDKKGVLSMEDFLQI
jgi:4-hydroxy-tetrahydrodipicolinate reductase